MTTPNAELKLCINCRFHKTAEQTTCYDITDRCTHQGNGVDLVSGVPIEGICKTLRGRTAACGKDALWFEASMNDCGELEKQPPQRPCFAMGDCQFDVHPPFIPPSSKTLRYFTHGANQDELSLESGNVDQSITDHWKRTTAEIEVFRFATDDAVNLSSCVNIGHIKSEIRLELTAAEIRDLVARLLDAEHDLVAYPSAVLAKKVAA